MVLNELNLSALEPEQSESVAKDTINRLFWTWFQYNLDREITIKKWVINIKFKVKDLEVVFKMLFGPPPFASVS
jgi:hypothetical protein